MDPRLQIVAITGAVALLLLVLELVRRRRADGTLRAAVAAQRAGGPRAGGLAGRARARWPGRWASSAAPNALFFVAVGFILLLLLHFSAAMSRLTDQSKVLAQRHALLEQRLHELESVAEAETEAEPSVFR